MMMRTATFAAVVAVFAAVLSLAAPAAVDAQTPTLTVAVNTIDIEPGRYTLEHEYQDGGNVSLLLRGPKLPVRFPDLYPDEQSWFYRRPDAEIATTEDARGRDVTGRRCTQVFTTYRNGGNRTDPVFGTLPAIGTTHTFIAYQGAHGSPDSIGGLVCDEASRLATVTFTYDPSEPEPEPVPETYETPEPPTGVVAVADGSCSVTLSWDNPGDPDIASYEYQSRQRGDPPAVWRMVPGSNADTTSVTIDLTMCDERDWIIYLRARDVHGHAGRYTVTVVSAASVTVVPAVPLAGLAMLAFVLLFLGGQRKRFS